LKFEKIIETCIYSSDLKIMKDFYVDYLGLDLISEEKGRHVFLKVGKSMLLIFNPENTRIPTNSIFPRSNGSNNSRQNSSAIWKYPQ
jgi:catechol 2,3-dioxygenase-like lactoylglutathione lyase family enzyme